LVNVGQWVKLECLPEAKFITGDILDLDDYKQFMKEYNDPVPITLPVTTTPASSISGLLTDNKSS
jgi:hypothetical protein